LSSDCLFIGHGSPRLMARKSTLKGALFATKEWVIGDGDASLSPRPSISRWEKLATSQANQWMTAIRLHDSGNYADAWQHYLFDAIDNRSAGYYAKATLSFILASECLTLIGQTALSTDMLRFARLCYAQRKSSSDGFDASKEIEIVLNQDLSKFTQTTRLEYVQ